MKLRNKKTGDIWEFEGFIMKASYETAKRAGAISGSLTCYANSISELNEEWEDYKPTEPLIKDEKIRKAKTMGETIDDYQRKIYELIKRSYPEMVGYTADCHEYKTEDGQFGVHTALFMHRSEEEECEKKM